MSGGADAEARAAQPRDAGERAWGSPVTKPAKYHDMITHFDSAESPARGWAP